MKRCEKHDSIRCEWEAEPWMAAKWSAILLLSVFAWCASCEVRRDACIRTCASRGLQCRDHAITNGAALCVRPTTNNIDVKVDQ